MTDQDKWKRFRRDADIGSEPTRAQRAQQAYETDKQFRARIRKGVDADKAKQERCQSCGNLVSYCEKKPCLWRRSSR